MAKSLRSRRIKGGPCIPVIARLEDEILLTSASPTEPQHFVYKFLTRTGGPQAGSGNDFDMNTNSSANQTWFDYIVPAITTFKFARINFVLTDNAPGTLEPEDFAGIVGGLPNGCLFQIIDGNGTTILQEFDTADVPIRTNDDFTPLAGVDAQVTARGSNDQLPIRLSIFKAGAAMKLTARMIIRWINRDDLSSIIKFRAMVQGTLL